MNMNTQVDIQMPIRKGGFVIGDVIQRLLMQDVPFTLYVDAGDDLELSSDHQRLLELIAISPENAKRIEKSTKVAFKRNRMRILGHSPYIYLADPDVLLPERPFFGSLIQAFERNPQLGAVGLCYQNNNHVACGSMMLKRKDFIRIGTLRGTGASCVCGYIQKQLQEFSLHVVPLKTLRARHLKSQYQNGYPEYKKVKFQLSSDFILPLSFLDDIIKKHGPHFKLFISNFSN